MRAEMRNLVGRKVLLAASTGGHLTQLVRLEPLLGVDPDSAWVTFESPQSRSLLAGRNVIYVPYVAPRDLRGVARAHLEVRHHVDKFEGAISTGAGIALSVLPQMAAHGKPSVYMESVSRIDGPSLTGRMLRHLPGLGLYAQHPTWPRTPWRIGPSVLDAYTTTPAIRSTSGPLKVLVALGTIRPYRFDRLIDAVLAFAKTTPCEITWQTGCTSRDDLPGTVTEQLEESDFRAAVRASDLVFTHAGVGVALTILDEGRVPVLMAREPGRHEHVDAHQSQIHRYLVTAGLAVDADAAFASPTSLGHALDCAVRPAARPTVPPTPSTLTVQQTSLPV